MVIPSFLLLTMMVIIPVLLSVTESFTTEAGAFTLEHYRTLFTDRAMIRNIRFTIYITVVSGVVALLISYVVAMYLRFSRTWVARWVKRLYFIPMFVPSVIATYGFIAFYGNHGWLARWLRLLSESPFPRVIFDAKGLLLAELWFQIPFATMVLGSALAAIPDSVVESARDVGANQFQILTRFIIPLSYKTMLVVMCFKFMGIIGSFTAPYLIGPNAPQMLGVAMQQVFGVYFKTKLAAALAVFMFLLCSMIGVLYVHSMMKEEKA